ncbi:hypothetical protein B0H34DRAFT_649677 [Crassisporium funariophilum]|nr:hypothetical protein B0H34DRAFT_649677 [Crassisporium funariophilum]
MTDTKQGESSSQLPQVTPPEPHASTSSQAPQVQAEVAPVADSTQTPDIQKTEDRAELLARARSFLVSPQVQHQDISAKRAFLVEKGLNDSEIEGLLQNLPPQLPSIPPRTYPQPPPSNLPVLLLGLARLFSWLAGGSVVLVFLYHRLLLPRITQTSLARHALKSHHLTLLRRLTTSLSALKESQAECFSVLPRSAAFKEPDQYVQCKSVADVVTILGEKDPDFSSVPQVTLLRCGIADFGKGKEEKDARPSTEDLFRYLEGHVPWLVSEEGLQYEQELWDTLSTCPLFSRASPSSTSATEPQQSEEATPLSHWEYTAPEPSSPPPLVTSLDGLLSVLPKDTKTRKSPFQHSLQTLSDFTGYISTQVYLPYRPSPGMGLPSNQGQNPVEDEVRREIRALKGLVLNRRSFMPSRPPYTSGQPRVTP